MASLTVTPSIALLPVSSAGQPLPAPSALPACLARIGRYAGDCVIDHDGLLLLFFLLRDQFRDLRIRADGLNHDNMPGVHHGEVGPVPFTATPNQNVGNLLSLRIRGALDVVDFANDRERSSQSGDLPKVELTAIEEYRLKRHVEAGLTCTVGREIPSAHRSGEQTYY
jgi:hypothetical protein